MNKPLNVYEQILEHRLNLLEKLTNCPIFIEQYLLKKYLRLLSPSDVVFFHRMMMTIAISESFIEEDNFIIVKEVVQKKYKDSIKLAPSRRQPLFTFGH